MDRIDRPDHQPDNRCPAWCSGIHRVTGSFIYHRAEVGQTTLQGDPLAVAILGLQSRSPGQADLGPMVALRWPYLAPDGPERPPASKLDGIDITAGEAEALAALLAQATVALRSGRRAGAVGSAGSW